jgi:hypothetical protein
MAKTDAARTRRRNACVCTGPIAEHCPGHTGNGCAELKCVARGGATNPEQEKEQLEMLRLLRLDDTEAELAARNKKPWRAVAGYHWKDVEQGKQVKGLPDLLGSQVGEQKRRSRKVLSAAAQATPKKMQPGTVEWSKEKENFEPQHGDRVGVKEKDALGGPMRAGIVHAVHQRLIAGASQTVIEIEYDSQPSKRHSIAMDSAEFMPLGSSCATPGTKRARGGGLSHLRSSVPSPAATTPVFASSGGGSSVFGSMPPPPMRLPAGSSMHAVRQRGTPSTPTAGAGRTPTGASSPSEQPDLEEWARQWTAREAAFAADKAKLEAQLLEYREATERLLKQARL